MKKTHVGVLVESGVEVLVADGAIDVENTSLAVLDGTDATVEVTLADGEPGQRLDIKCVDATESVVVTPDNFQDGTTITFAADSACTLRYASGAWHLINDLSTTVA